jgi:tRNA dimethylallyltransferase
LYLKALCEGLDPMPAIDQKINEETIKKYSENGISWLRNELQNADPIYFSKGEIENPSRMLRALAFSLSVGRSITEFQTGIAKERPFRIIKIGLEMPRDLLYQRINLRVDQMMKDGLLEEAQNLYPIRHLKNLNTVGYSELFDYFDNQTSLAIAIDKIKQHSRNYAKRQLTWFKKDKDFNWFDANDNNLVEKLMNFIANS